MTKKPVAGRVKTRLAADLGDAVAAEVYRRLLAHVHALAIELSTRGWPVCWYVADDPGLNWINGFAAPGHGTVAQMGDDLGQRMANALARELERNPAGVLMIGCDCPELDVDRLSAAAATLDTADVVITPADDGGYVMIGMSKPHLQLFSGPVWGSEKVLAKTLTIATENQISCTLLPTCSDLDTARQLKGFPGFDPRRNAD